MPELKATILGSGTSQGVPVIACECEVCRSTDPKDNRSRTSLLVESETTTVVIDTGPDFRQQMLRERVKNLDAIVFTHEHKDHVAGMDDVRAFNFKKGGKAIPIYASERVEEALKREYAYIFSKDKYPGTPEIDLIPIDKENFTVGDLLWQPVEVMHYKLPVKGFRIGKLAYITDANYIPENEIKKLQGIDTLIINALRHQPHLSHFNLQEAVDMVDRLQPAQAFFTHISHLMGKHKKITSQLPDHINLAYDGLQIESTY
jgi:phosphoribosyl 1,2-cyclic phosphate phosphodiesterase